MNTKHTPGPWVHGQNTRTKRGEWMKIYADGTLIARVQNVSPIGQRKATDFEEEGANAHLISYAPALLQMVYDLKKQMERLTSDEPLTQYERDGIAEWIGEAHELLQKVAPEYYKNANQ